MATLSQVYLSLARQKDARGTREREERNGRKGGEGERDREREQERGKERGGRVGDRGNP